MCAVVLSRHREMTRLTWILAACCVLLLLEQPAAAKRKFDADFEFEEVSLSPATHVHISSGSRIRIPPFVLPAAQLPDLSF